MPNRRLILGILAAGVLASVVYAVLSSSREPTYNGRPLSDWTTALNTYSYPSTAQADASEAIKNIGTNAIPHLLRWIKYPERGGKPNLLLSLFDKLIHWLGFRRSFGDQKRDLANGAVLAFAVLGPLATNALPELTALLESPDGTAVDARAGQSLAGIGPAALPIFLANLTNQNSEVQARAAFHLVQTASNAQSAVPQLITHLSGSDWLAVWAAGRTLGNLKTDPAVVVPILQALLADPHPARRAAAVQALADYGPLARPAVPALLNALNTTNGYMIPEIQAALRKIAPEALTNTPPR
jgi:hypothetical protein